MPRYYLEIKPSAAKELDALSDALFVRIDRKIMALAEKSSHKCAFSRNRKGTVSTVPQKARKTGGFNP